jgi:hypothetical protein
MEQMGTGHGPVAEQVQRGKQWGASARKALPRPIPLQRLGADRDPVLSQRGVNALAFVP